MSKYEPIPQFLSSAGKHRVRLGFKEIEDVLGFALPKSAYAHEAWWSNNDSGHSHARTWMRAGWRTSGVDLAGRKVTFERSGQDPHQPKSDPFGCMAGTVTFAKHLDLTAPSESWNADVGRLFNE